MSEGGGPPPAIGTRDVAMGASRALLSRLGSLVEVVSQPAFLWMFGLTTYGLYTVLWAWVSVAENVLDLGMTSALQRVVPQADDEAYASAALAAALAIGILPCVLVALGVSLAAHPIAELVNAAPRDRPALASAIALFAWALPLWAFVEIGTSALRARRVFGPEIRLRVLWEQLIRLPVAALLWLGGVHTLGLMVAHLVSLSVTAVLTLRLLSRYYDLRLLTAVRPSAAVVGETLLAGLSVLPANIIARLFTDGPPVVLNAWFPGAAGAAAAGLYGVARKLSSLIQMIRIALSYVMGPLASAAARHDRASIEPLYGYATRLATVLAVPIAAVMVAGVFPILALFGPGASAAAPLIAPLAAARVIDAVTGPGSAVQQVASARRQSIYSNVAGLLVTLALLMLLLDPLGATGMAVAVAAGLTVTSLFVAGQLYLTDGLNPFREPYSAVLRTAAILGLTTALAARASAIMPAGVALVWLVAVLLGSLWLTVRLALPAADRATFGKTGRRLRLA